MRPERTTDVTAKCNLRSYRSLKEYDVPSRGPVQQTKEYQHHINPRTYRQIHTPTLVQGRGGGDGWNPSPEFPMCYSISKRFYLQWEALDLFNKMRYILWLVELLEACDVTNNGRYLSPSWILPRTRNKVKTASNGNFLALHEKQHINKHFARFQPQDLLLLLEEVEKTRIFSQKWLDHLLLMTLYLVTIATNHH